MSTTFSHSSKLEWRGLFLKEIQNQQQGVQECGILVNSYNQMKSYAESLHAKNEILEKSLDECHQQHAEDKVKELTQQSNYRASVKELTGKLSQLREELTLTYKEKLTQAERLLAVTLDQKSLQDIIQAKEKEIATYKATIASLQQTVQTQQQTIQESKEVMEVVGQELGSLRMRYSRGLEREHRLQAENNKLLDSLSKSGDWELLKIPSNNSAESLAVKDTHHDVAAKDKEPEKGIGGEGRERRDGQGTNHEHAPINCDGGIARGGEAKGSDRGATLLGTNIEHSTAVHGGEPVKDTKSKVDPIGLQQSFSAHGDEINYICFSPNGSLMATGGSDCKLLLWEQGSKLRHKLSGATQSITCADFGYRDDKILVGSNDKAIRLYHVTTGRILYTLTGHENKILAVKSNGNSTTGFSGSSDRTLKLWDLKRGNIIHTFNPKSSCHDVVLIDDTGISTISGYADGHLRVYDSRSKQCSCDIVNVHSTAITSLDLSTNRTMILTGSRDNSLKMVDIRMSNKVVASYSGDGYRSSSNWSSVRFGCNSQYAISGSYNGRVYVWNTSNNKLDRILKGHSGPVSACAYSQSNNLLATGDKNHMICLWKLQ